MQSDSLRLWLLGSWHAELNGHPLPALPTRHSRALLARLALAHPRPIERSQVMSDLFPFLPADKAARHLRTTLYYVRRVLPNALHATPDAIALEQHLDVVHDVAEFDALSTPGATQTALEQAIQVYRGPFLQGVIEGWATNENERLHQRYIDALQRLVALGRVSGSLPVALEAAERWSTEEPWNENAYQALIEILLLHGDRARAEDRIAAARTLLRGTLDQSFEQTLNTLGRAAARLPYAQTPTAPRSTPTSLPDIDFRQFPLFGRERQLAHLNTLWEAAQRGESQVVAIEGPAGVGKSRLAGELAAQARLRVGNVVLVGTSDEQTSGHALGHLRAAINNLTDGARTHAVAATQALAEHHWSILGGFGEWHALTPERDWAAPARLDAASELARRQSAVMAWFGHLTTSGPTLLLLENAQHADKESLSVAHALGQSGRRVLVVLTRRPGNGLEDQSTMVLPLAVLDGDTIRALLQAVLLPGVERTTLDRLALHCGGNPLIAREVMTTLIGDGMLLQDISGLWHLADNARLPDPHDDLLDRRLELLTPEAHHLADIIAVLGRPAEDALLARIAPHEDVRTDALAELIGHHVLIERNGRLLFDHDWMREASLARLSADACVALHGCVVDALLAAPKHSPSEVMYHAAGALRWDAAWPAALAAAELAWSDHQHAVVRQALDIADHALQALGIPSTDARRWPLLGIQEAYFGLVERDTRWSDTLRAMETLADENQRLDWRSEALIRRGRAYREQGRLVEAEPPLREAARLARTAGVAALEARACTALAAVLEDRGAVDDAAVAQATAVAAADKSGDEALHTHTLGVLAYMQMRAGQVAEADRLNAAVLADPIIQLHPVLEARFTRHHGIIKIAAREYEAGLHLLRRSISQSQQIGDLFGLLTCQTSLVYFLALTGQFAESRLVGDVTIAQARRMAARTHLCWLLLAQARAEYATGDHEHARELASESARIGEAAGDIDGAAASLAVYATIALAANRLSEAQRAIEHAEQLIAPISHPSIIIAHVVARVRLAVGHRNRARQAAHAAIAQAQMPGLTSVYATEALWDAALVLGQLEPAHTVDLVREQAYAHLLTDLAAMTSPQARRSLLDADDAHRSLAAFRGTCGRRLVWLPMRDAPTGRPLHTDEIIPVIWTIHAPDDPATLVACRHLQLQRMVAEAAAQGAVATVETLADALSVVPRTIQRDLQTLRRRGIVLTTRGHLHTL